MVNVTLLCANRPRLLKQALDSIGDLSDAKVMIRDAGMNPEVFNVCNEWAIPRDAKGIHYSLRTDPMGTGPARNEVISFSENVFGRGDYLYLSDDDVYFKRPDWLNILKVAYSKAWDEGYRVIGAYYHPYNGPIAGEAGCCVPPVGIDAPPYHVLPVHALALQSMLMRWEVWDAYGPFCETPVGKVCQSEDVAFTNKIHEAGFKIGVISPALLVNCGVTNSFGQPIPGADSVRAQAPLGVIVE